jgi:hypothetical protein
MAVSGLVEKRRLRLRELAKETIWTFTSAATEILAIQSSAQKIEIDITYSCNLTCFNCDRSCGQAPTRERMTLEQINVFVKESIAKRVKWERIRLLGGEPILHPNFLEILSLLIAYRNAFSKRTVIEVTTNGYGKKAERIIEKIPAGIKINNSHKQPTVAPDFDTFNVAPRDLDAYKQADYRNGCWISQTCGIGLSSAGYYPCAAAGGIDRPPYPVKPGIGPLA